MLIVSSSVQADFNGTFEDNSDGSYNVTVSDGYHEFYGYADEQDDDTLTVNLKDNFGNTYVGQAHRNLHGGYALDLRKDVPYNVEPVRGYIYSR